MSSSSAKKAPMVQSQEDAPPPAYSPSTATYTATKQMTIGCSLNARSLEIGVDGKRDWSNSLCGCLERPGLTLAACICPCSVWSANHTRLQHLEAKGTPNPSPERVGLFCALYTLSPNILGIGQVVMQCFSRYTTRERYAIRGSPLEDVLIGALCTTCSLVQEYREIEEEELALQEGAIALPRDEEAQ